MNEHKQKPENEERIRDIPQYKKLVKDVNSLASLSRLLPILRLFGIDTSDLKSATEQVHKLKDDIEHFVDIPDRFNDIFGSRGWISYELMNINAMKKAIELSETKNIDAAESFLINYYDEKIISMNLHSMRAIPAFQPREDLAQKAKEDYLVGRYHASVPVILSLLDGLVNDIAKDKGFFAEGIKLEAWDSISAHSKGLGTLTKILQTQRKRTTTTALTIPYRHGILHGRDLGYDNKLVAAKSWAAFFSIWDWALAVHHNRTEPEPTPQPTLREAFNKLLQAYELRRKIEQWTPRSTAELAQVPRSGIPKDYDSSTPEFTMVTFLCYWKDRNYGGMAECLAEKFRGKYSKAAGSMRSNYNFRELISFSIQRILDDAPSLTKIVVDLTFIQSGENKKGTLQCNLIYTNSEGETLVRESAGGKWKIVPQSIVVRE